ncbi:MAG: pimeloyl-ACP methyl ester carboxylesterase [Planctomycetota bacterium]|jgi:pimeloyl-ACP methyl ester carboxylesterase
MSITPLSTSYTRSGTGSALVFIHGVGLNKSVWDSYLDAFTDSCSVICYDTLGHGESPIPPATVTLDDYLEQLLELIDSLGLEKVSLCGHSMGALIALGFAIKYPHRCNALVSLMCAYDRDPEHQQRQSRVAEILAGADSEQLLETTLQRWFTPQDQDNPVRRNKIDQVRHWLLANDKSGYSRAYRVLTENGETYVGQLAQISVPALFITAEFDPNSTVEMCEKMAAQVVGATSRVIKDERHMGQYLAPEKFLPPIERFLQQHMTGGGNYDQ